MKVKQKKETDNSTKAAVINAIKQPVAYRSIACSDLGFDRYQDPDSLGSMFPIDR